MQISISQRIKSYYRDRVKIRTDKGNSGATFYEMRDNILPNSKVSSSINDGGYVSLCAYANSFDNFYSLFVKWKSDRGLFVNLVNSFSLVADDQVFNFDLESNLIVPTGEYKANGEHYYLEGFFLIVEKDFIKLIGDSSNIKIVIRGKIQEINGYLSERNIKRFRDFYYNYLGGNK